jgi:cytochrome bd ubiquinol oxidase subunit II
VSDLAGVVLFLGVTLYAVFGGADFGAGFWDLTAGGVDRGRRPRGLIDQAIGPVWEANHVWLIFCLVVLWTSFPGAFASIMETLYVPLAVAAVGIVARGAGFAFGKVSETLTQQRLYGVAFAVSSLITPFFLGAVAGGIASGRVPADGAGGPVASWVNPTSMLGGTLAVIVCAYLAAVFLVADSNRRGLRDLERYFRARAVGAGLLAGGVAVAGIWVLRGDAPRLFHHLIGVALPLVVLSGLCGLGALAVLGRGAPRAGRPLAAAAVAAVVGGWGVAQYPFLLGTHLPLGAGAAPDATLRIVVAIFLVAAVTCVPSLVYLYTLGERGRLDGTSL